MIAKINKLEVLLEAKWTRDEAKNVLIGERYLKLVNFLYDGDKIAIIEYKNDKDSIRIYGALEKRFFVNDYNFEVSHTNNNLQNLIKLGVHDCFNSHLKVNYPYNLDNFLITAKNIVYTDSMFYILNAVKITENFYKVIQEKIKLGEADRINNITLVEYDEFWTKYRETNNALSAPDQKVDYFIKVIMPLLI